MKGRLNRSFDQDSYDNEWDEENVLFNDREDEEYLAFLRDDTLPCGYCGVNLNEEPTYQTCSGCNVPLCEKCVIIAYTNFWDDDSIFYRCENCYEADCKRKGV